MGKTIKESMVHDHPSDVRYFSYVDVAAFLDPNEQIDFEKLKFRGINDVVLAIDKRERDDNVDGQILDLIRTGLRVISDKDFYGEVFEKIPVDSITKSWFLEKFINSTSLIDSITKRLLDIFVAIVGLLAVSPLFILIAILIKLTSKGKVFFVQPRQGRFDRPFKMYKFRTMTQSESRQDASGGFTKVGDARVTLIGKILRPLHLDELPQLINILFGDMSIVGPRPEAYAFAKRMAGEIDLYSMRYLVRPGLTGHAQIMCGYMMDTLEDTVTKIEFDLYYILKRNVVLDLRIMIRTFFIVLKSVLRPNSNAR
ncbi:MAG: sugar transferase [Bdellovibrionota bacterium]